MSSLTTNMQPQHFTVHLVSSVSTLLTPHTLHRILTDIGYDLCKNPLSFGFLICHCPSQCNHAFLNTTINPSQIKACYLRKPSLTKHLSLTMQNAYFTQHATLLRSPLSRLFLNSLLTLPLLSTRLILSSI